MSDTPAIELPDLEDATAAEVVAWATRTFGANIVLACSFQKEESVLLEYLFQADPNGRAFALDTDLLFPETYDLLATVEARYSTTIERWRGPTLAEQSAEHGDELWKRDPSLCCAIRKIGPLKQGLSGLDAWITGIRRDQSPARADAKKVEWDEQFGLVKINPLADWDDKDVWREVHKLGLPYHPLHDQGFASIGCVPCTRPGEGREGRWAGTDKVECGLHQEAA
ncbi:MAG: phosphoadenylyl-sulfate reductase [Patulibacter minatonensis]